MFSIRKYFSIIGLSLSFCFSLQAKSFDWNDWQDILANGIYTTANAEITSNLLNYQSLVNDPRIRSIRLALQNYDPSSLAGDDKKAFYINAYNFYAVSMVLKHWPVKSIRDIGNFVFQVWDKDVGKINGKWITLNDIEHKILRPMGDPRIHFAIVCASLSCPDLRTEIYTSNKLNKQLESQVDVFLRNTTKGYVRVKHGVAVSMIFKWFEEDFDRQGGILDFIEKYQSLDFDIEDIDFLPYNWHLNAYSATKTKK